MAVEDVEREAPYFPFWASRYERVFAMFITSSADNTRANSA